MEHEEMTEDEVSDAVSAAAFSCPAEACTCTPRDGYHAPDCGIWTRAAERVNR